jgi:AcrB/AcrD/AcrF family
MWIVALALRRPYTFTVFAILILIAGLVAITRTAKDIFPSINIPVISSIWSYAGMAPEGMESHITTQAERGLTTTVDNIERKRCKRKTDSLRSRGRGQTRWGSWQFQMEERLDPGQKIVLFNWNWLNCGFVEHRNKLLCLGR